MISGASLLKRILKKKNEDLLKASKANQVQETEAQKPKVQKGKSFSTQLENYRFERVLVNKEKPKDFKSAFSLPLIEENGPREDSENS